MYNGQQINFDEDSGAGGQYYQLAVKSEKIQQLEINPAFLGMTKVF
jgi:hypothetical protein